MTIPPYFKGYFTLFVINFIYKIYYRLSIMLAKEKPVYVSATDITDVNRQRSAFMAQEGSSSSKAQRHRDIIKVVQLISGRDEIIFIPFRYFQFNIILHQTEFLCSKNFVVSRPIKPTLLMNLNMLKEKLFPTADTVLGTHQVFNNYLLNVSMTGTFR